MKSKEYYALESISPYSQLDQNRLSEAKQNFQWCFQILQEKVFKSNNIGEKKPYSLLDVGCANGEFLHHYTNVFLNHDCSKTGIDLTQRFVDVANSLALENTQFLCADMFDKTLGLEEKYDIVTCFGTIPVFKDPSTIIERLFSFAKPGGYVIFDGLINLHNISVNINFCDYSTAESSGLWRSDFNQHAEVEINTIISKFSDQHEIVRNDFMADIPKVEDSPAINVWTFTTSQNKKVVMNGANLILNPSLLFAQKK